VADAWSWQPYHKPVPIVLKSGSLIFLDPSGPVNACIACIGIALAFTQPLNEASINLKIAKEELKNS